jgi:hypothetical protein
MIGTKAQKKRYKLSNIIDGVATARTNKKTKQVYLLTNKGNWVTNMQEEDDEYRLAIVGTDRLDRLKFVLENYTSSITKREIAHIKLKIILLKG